MPKKRGGNIFAGPRETEKEGLPDRAGRPERERKWNRMSGMAADRAVNLPVQMMSLVDRSGRQTPMGFRFEDDEHQRYNIKVERVICREKLNLAGIREIKIICGAYFGETERLLELRYNVDSQQWRIYQFLT